MHTVFPSCDDCFPVLSDPDEDFQPLTPYGLDLPSNSVVTFLSPTSSPSKTLSNPSSTDETPISPLQTTNNPTFTVPDAALSPSTRLKFPISLHKTDPSKNTEELPPFSSLLSDVRPLLHAPITSNFSLISLVLDVNITVNTIIVTHGEQNDPASINIYITVSNQNSPHGI